jgi:hypothetical protein
MTKSNSHCEPARTLRVHLIDGTPEGLRHVDSLVSMVTVTAGPLPTLNSFTKCVDNKVGFMDYVCEGPLSYIGHGYAERRLGEKLTEKDRSICQAYVIHSLDPRFGKDLVQKLEDRLIEIARANLVPLANDPMVGGLGGSAARSLEIEELLRDVRQKLWVAGCRLFEQPHPAGKPSNTVCDGVEVVGPAELARLEMTQPMQLTCYGLQARGCWVGPKLIVLPGSDFSLIARKGLTKYNLDRRAFVRKAGVLEDIPGVTDRVRLRAGLAFDSAAVAAKIIVGKHVGTKMWTPVSASAPQQDATEQSPARSNQIVPPPRLVVGAGHG